MFNPELDRGLALSEGNVQALVGQRDLKTLALPRVIGKECSEHSFEFIVAAGRRVVGATKMARTHPLGEHERAIERAVPPYGLSLDLSKQQTLDASVGQIVVQNASVRQGHVGNDLQSTNGLVHWQIAQWAIDGGRQFESRTPGPGTFNHDIRKVDSDQLSNRRLSIDIRNQFQGDLCPIQMQIHGVVASERVVLVNHTAGGDLLLCVL